MLHNYSLCGYHSSVIHKSPSRLCAGDVLYVLLVVVVSMVAVLAVVVGEVGAGVMACIV